MSPIAIIGMSCRLPGAANLDEYWRLLRGGECAICDVPPDRWDLEQYYDPDPAAPGKLYARRGGFLEQIDQFDPAYFGISHREALRMDPQQRLFLELCVEALEDAGLVPQRLKGSATAVMAGFGVQEYQIPQLSDPRCIDAYTNTGYFPNLISARVSYLFDFRGPCLSLDTACSSSLVAVHLACQSLRNGEAGLALVGGVNLMISPLTTIGYCKLSAMSAVGLCQAFDAGADGYVRGEGGGVVVLKPLPAALADGDDIHAVIRGTAINQDGRTNGQTAPNRFAQEAVLRAAYQQAKVSPGDVQYVEAHGTGTILGDPIEAMALGKVLSVDRPANTPCAIGSVKSNIGHLEAAAGMASLIKVALSLRHRELPPTLHFRSPNPHIPFQELQLEVQTSLTPWPVREDCLALAGVSSFGFGGTNAHAVLEAPPGCELKRLDSAETASAIGPQLLTLSARSPAALQDQARAYLQWLAPTPPAPLCHTKTSLELADICYSASVHRGHDDHRWSIVRSSIPRIVQGLDSFLEGTSTAETSTLTRRTGRRVKIAFLFTGQGSQFVGMGQRLFQTQPVFRKTLKHCAEILEPLLPEPLLSVVSLTGTNGPFNEAKQNEAMYAQLALFSLEYALAELWRSWGITPDVVVGHSLGEYVAACVAGVFSLEDGLRLVAERSRLIQQLPSGGAMAAVFAAEERVQAILAAAPGAVSLAAINGPDNVVISGSSQGVEWVIDQLRKEAVQSRKLSVSYAFHSPLIDSIAEPFRQFAESVQYNSPQIHYISNLTGQMLNKRLPLDAHYWAEHLRQPVQFAAGMATLGGSDCRLIVELGPQPTLMALGQANLPDSPAIWLTSLKRGKDDQEQILESLGQVYQAGCEVNWPAVYAGQPRRRVKLPGYPFQRERVWFDAPDDTPVSKPARFVGQWSRLQLLPHEMPQDQPSVDRHPLLGRRIAGPLPTFELQWHSGLLPYYCHRFINGCPLVPAAAFLGLAIAAAQDALPAGSWTTLTQVSFPTPLTLPEDCPILLRVIVAPCGVNEASFHICSVRIYGAQPDDPTSSTWPIHATGRISRATNGDVSAVPPKDLVDPVRRGLSPVDDLEQRYRKLRPSRLDLGRTLAGFGQLWRKDGESLAQLDFFCDTEQGYSASAQLAAAVDAGFLLPMMAVSADQQSIASNCLAKSPDLEFARFYERENFPGWAHAMVRQEQDGPTDATRADMNVLDLKGQILAEFRGLRWGDFHRFQND